LTFFLFVCIVMIMLKLNTNKIRNEMERKGISVADIAGRLDKTPAAIYDILKRRPVSQADRFAEILELDARDLVVNE
jgi:transcriptional regulator with XRE-family HTH domain